MLVKGTLIRTLGVSQEVDDALRVEDACAGTDTCKSGIRAGSKPVRQ